MWLKCWLGKPLFFLLPIFWSSSFHINVLQIDGSEPAEFGKKFINPWSTFTIEELSKKIHPQITKYDVRQFAYIYFAFLSNFPVLFLISLILAFWHLFQGYHLSKKVYSGKVALSSLKKSSRNKIIEIGNFHDFATWFWLVALK